MTKYKIVIPARFASTRLPGKPLALLAGKPMLEWVYQAAIASAATEVVIATDDSRISLAAKEFGAEVVITAAEHSSGSERIAECCRILGWPEQSLIVNLQGDEPLMPPACLDQVASLLQSTPGAGIASLYWPISGVDEFADTNVVKVTCDARDRALYFSRSPIPADGIDIAKRHLGLYAYRNHELQQLVKLPESPLERRERLEQLRWLSNGKSVAMARASKPIPAGVDSEEDLHRVATILAETAI